MAYNPGNQNQGGQLLAGGILDGIKSLTNAYVQADQLKEQDKLFQSRAKATEGLIKSYLPKEKADELLRLDPKETPEGRYNRLTDTVGNFVIGNRLDQQKKQEQQLNTDTGALNKALSQFMPQTGQQQIMGGTPFGQIQFNGAGAQSQFDPTKFAQSYFANGGSPASFDKVDQIIKTFGQMKPAGNAPQKFRNVAPMVDAKKNFLGYSVFDETTGQTGMLDAKTGEIKDLPEGAEPITATGLQKSIPDVTTFRKFKSDLTDAKISLKNMDRYMKSVGDADVGMARLADKFTAGIKTYFGGKEKLTLPEMANKVGQGQLQGLLGSNRTNVVGGGVMTEQDALRIIQRLGGDFDSLSNPEVVKAAISQVYGDRYQQYQDNLKFYNAGVDDYWGARGFEKDKPVPFSNHFTSDYEPQQTQQVEAPAMLAPKGINSAVWGVMTPEEKALWQPKKK